MAELGDMCSEDKEDVEKGAVSKETDCHQNFENCLLFWGRSRYVCGCVCVCMGVWVCVWVLGRLAGLGREEDQAADRP